MAADMLTDLQKQLSESKTATNDALRRLNEMSKRAGMLEEEAVVLILQLSKTEKARDAAMSSSEDRTRDVKAVEARVRMSSDKLVSLNRRESTNCDLKVIIRKVADAQGGVTNLVMRLQCSTVSSYASIHSSSVGALVEVSKCLKKMFSCEARNLQQGVCEAVNAVAESTRGQFAGARVLWTRAWGRL